MSYAITRIGDKRLEPFDLPADMEKFSCCCCPSCTELVPEDELVECTEECGLNGEMDSTDYECGKYVWKDHLATHIKEYHWSREDWREKGSKKR